MTQTREHDTEKAVIVYLGILAAGDRGLTRAQAVSLLGRRVPQAHADRILRAVAASRDVEVVQEFEPGQPPTTIYRRRSDERSSPATGGNPPPAGEPKPKRARPVA